VVRHETLLFVAIAAFALLVPTLAFAQGARGAAQELLS
jgi:hypothetical protein